MLVYTVIFILNLFYIGYLRHYNLFNSLINADLRSARMSGATLTDSDFTNANLFGALVDDGALSDPTLTVDGAIFPDGSNPES